MADYTDNRDEVASSSYRRPTDIERVCRHKHFDLRLNFGSVQAWRRWPRHGGGSTFEVGRAYLIQLAGGHPRRQLGPAPVEYSSTRVIRPSRTQTRIMVSNVLLTPA